MQGGMGLWGVGGGRGGMAWWGNGKQGSVSSAVCVCRPSPRPPPFTGLLCGILGSRKHEVQRELGCLGSHLPCSDSVAPRAGSKTRQQGW